MDRAFSKILILVIFIILLIGGFFVWQKMSIQELSGPAGITIPSDCKIAGAKGSIDPSVQDYILQSNEWLVDCGSRNNDARGVFGSVLEVLGWQFCDSGLASGHWWKDGIITSVAESAGTSYSFRVTQSNGPDCSPAQSNNETADWQTYRNREFEFELKYPEGWTVVDNSGRDTCCLNIFNSREPYEGAFLKSNIMKAQFQYHVDKSISGKQAYINKLVKNESGDPITPIDKDLIEDLPIEDILNVIKFKGGPGNMGYVIPIKQDFSEVIKVIIWNLDPSFERLLSTFKFTSKKQIQTGKIDIDTNQITELQRAVDAESQPWRLDIVMSALADLPRYGFTQDDLKTLQCPHIASNWVVGKDITSLPCEVSHDSQKYVIIVSQPQPGIGKIWMVSEIELAPFK